MTTRKRIADLRRGDIVEAHGATFRILNDAEESQSHRPKYWVSGKGYETHQGPCDIAYTKGECLHGYTKGYIWPGCHWPFQGSTAVTVRVIRPE